MIFDDIYKGMFIGLILGLVFSICTYLYVNPLSNKEEVKKKVVAVAAESCNVGIVKAIVYIHSKSKPIPDCDQIAKTEEENYK